VRAATAAGAASAERYVAVEAPVDGGTLGGGEWNPDAAGLPLLAIHGITANHRAWRLAAGALGDTRIIAPDMRGRGRSGDLPGPYALTDLADDTARMLDALGVQRAAVVGHSMGAFVAVRLAERFPDRVERLVLIDGGLPIPWPEGIPRDDVAEVVLGPALERLRLTFASLADYEKFWRQHPAIGPWWNPTFADYVAYDLVGQAPELHSSVSEEAVTVNALELYGADGYAEALAALNIPIDFIRAPRGLLDGPPLYPPATLTEWQQRLPGMRVHQADDVNHYTILMTENGLRQVVPVLDPKENDA
jgi:pimeloyl-ACP methyl ester carboxylesterase